MRFFKVILLIVFLFICQSRAFSEMQNYTEKDISYQSGGYEISGTLTVPKNLEGKGPAIIFLTGSGPQPRDGIEEGDTSGIPPIYKILAHNLADKGIITLRCDDRIYSLKKKLNQEELINMCMDLTINEELIEDGINGAKFLMEQPEVDSDRVYILGHSLGGFAAPFAAEQIEGLAGVILFAPGGEKIFDSMIRQAETQLEYYEKNYPGQIGETDIEAAEKEIAQWKEWEEAVYNKTLPKGQFVLGATDKYYYDLYERDVLSTAKNLPCKILHLWGEYDPNITKKDYDNWHEALKDKEGYTTVTFPGLNHYFYYVDQYYPIGLTIVYEQNFDSKVTDTIAAWIEKK